MQVPVFAMWLEYFLQVFRISDTMHYVTVNTIIHRQTIQLTTGTHFTSMA